MSIIHHPHDHFVKASLKQKAIAVDFLKAHLPRPLLKRIDLSTLQPIDKSYIDHTLKEIHGDIVYRCQIDGETGYLPVLLLIEHQSTPDAHMAFRLLHYSWHVIEDHLSAGYDDLPLVLPFCLYHGRVSPYPYSRDVYDDFQDPKTARALMFKPFGLMDITDIPMEALEQHGLAGIMEILLKAYSENRLMSSVKRMVTTGLLQTVMQKTPLHYFESMLSYIAELNNQQEELSVDQLLELLQTALPDKRDNIMTIREQLERIGELRGREEGEKRGILLGMHAARNEDAKKMLAKGIDYATVKEITELSDAELQAL